jgi:hypothetical protein
MKKLYIGDFEHQALNWEELNKGKEEPSNTNQKLFMIGLVMVVVAIFYQFFLNA